MIHDSDFCVSLVGSSVNPFITTLSVYLGLLFIEHRLALYHSFDRLHLNACNPRSYPGPFDFLLEASTLWPSSLALNPPCQSLFESHDCASAQVLRRITFLTVICLGPTASVAPALMSSYGSGRDPRVRPNHIRDKLAARNDPIDYDAPSTSGTAASNAFASNVSPSSSHNLASTSASTLDRVASSSRNPLIDRLEPTTARTSTSTSIESPSDLVARLYASDPERQLFDQIEIKSFAISEDRRNLEEELSKLKSVAEWLNDAGPNDPRNIARLAEQQQVVTRLEQKIKSNSADLYRMQLQWRVDVDARIIPALLAAATAPFEAKLQDLKHERGKDRKRQEELDHHARTFFGQSSRFQSDLNKIRSDLSALTRGNNRLHHEITDTRKELRKDVDKDVGQINDNRQRIKALEKKVAALQEKLDHPNVAQFSSSASAPAPTVSANPPVSKPAMASLVAPLPTSSALDSRVLPAEPAQPAAPAAVAAQPSAASANGTAPTQDSVLPRPPSPSKATALNSESKAVTQAQFRKWVANHEQDLEWRLDEIKDLAIQEATQENQACMDQRLRALARKWKSKALLREHATEAASSPKPGNPSNEATAPADGAAPMDIDTEQQQNQASDAAIAPNAKQSANTTVAPTNPNGANPPVGLQSNSAAGEATSTSQASAAAASSTSKESKRSSGTVLAAPSDSAPAANQVASSSSTLQPPGPPLLPPGQKENDSKASTAAISAAILKNMQNSLNKVHTQLTTLQKDTEVLRQFEREWLSRLLESPDKFEQLLTALKAKGLGHEADHVRAAVSHLGTQIVTIAESVVSLRTFEEESRKQIKALEEGRRQIMDTINKKIEWMQKQYEALDDQAALQGALLVKLSEHANPRQPRRKASQLTGTSGPPALC